MGNVRTANQYSGAAKTKAITLFTDLYNQGTPEIKDLLADFVVQLSWILKRKLMFTNSKNKLCLLLLNEARAKLSELVAQQPHITVNVKKLISNIYTAINPTLGDFWRNVRTLTIVTGSISAALYLGYQVYRFTNVAQNESGPFNQLIKLMLMLNKTPTETGQSLLPRFIAAITKNLESTEEGGFSKLMTILSKIDKEKPKAIGDLLEVITENMEDKTEGSLGRISKILARIPQQTINNGVPAIIAYLRSQTPSTPN